jgi:hypothetical protein
MIPLLINQSIISRDFSLQLSIRLADSDLAVIGLTGIGSIRKISVLDWCLSYWPNGSFYNCIDRFDHIKANKSKLIKKSTYLLQPLGRYVCWWNIGPRVYHPPSSHCFRTDNFFFKYIYCWNLHFLNNVTNIKTTVLLPQA